MKVIEKKRAKNADKNGKSCLVRNRCRWKQSERKIWVRKKKLRKVHDMFCHKHTFFHSTKTVIYHLNLPEVFWLAMSLGLCWTTTVLTHDIMSRILNRCMPSTHSHQTTQRHIIGMLVAWSNLQSSLKDSKFLSTHSR